MIGSEIMTTLSIKRSKKKNKQSKWKICWVKSTTATKSIHYQSKALLTPPPQKNLDVPFNNFSKKGEVHTMEASSMEATPFKPQFLPQ